MAAFAVVLLVSAAALDARGAPPGLAQCREEPHVLSCENRTAIGNTCCSPTPGGLVLQTQLWDAYTGYEAQGQLLPENTWAIHGLWPDNCDGTYESYCDFARQYDPAPVPTIVHNKTVPLYNGTTVDKFIEDLGRYDLLANMRAYWVPQGSPDTAFWAHEFSKHATCFSTFDVKCYDRYREHEDLVDFFDTVIKAYKQYPTFDWLKDASIVPSNSTTYALADIQDALRIASGSLPYVGCSTGNGAASLTEVWYYSHAVGPVQNGVLVPIEATTNSTCPDTGIHYYERTPSSVRRA